MNIFSSAWHWFANLFHGFNKEKVATIIDDITHFANMALPAVQMVIDLTPTPVDNIILDALKTLGLTAEQVLKEPIDAFRHGAKLSLAVEIFKALLIDKVTKDGKLQIGSTILAAAEDVLHLNNDLLRSAVNAALTILRGGK